MAQENLFQALLEIGRRVAWRSESEERYVFQLLYDAEQEARAGETVQGEKGPEPFHTIIPAAPIDAPKPVAPTAVADAIDYDKLADAMIRAQERAAARAAGVPAPADVPPAAVVPPAPQGQAPQAPAGWVPPAPAEIPQVPVHAGAAAMADPNAVPPAPPPAQ